MKMDILSSTMSFLIRIQLIVSLSPLSAVQSSWPFPLTLKCIKIPLGPGPPHTPCLLPGMSFPLDSVTVGCFSAFKPQLMHTLSPEPWDVVSSSCYPLIVASVNHFLNPDHCLYLCIS